MESVRNICEIAGIDVEPYLAKPTEEEIERDKARAEAVFTISRLEFLDEWPGKELSTEVLQEFGVRKAPGHLVWRGGLEWEQTEFDDMIVIPLFSDESELVGWTTRSMSNSHESRNNPNSWPGSQRDILYGLGNARSNLRHYGHKLILVEGQTDVMAMWSAGISNVVGLRGATLSDGQWSLLERWHIKEATLCLDGDEGGRTATKAIAQRRWNSPSIILSVAQLPDGFDPDGMISDGETLALMLALSRPPSGAGVEPGRLTDSTEFLLRGLEDEYDVNTLSGRRAFIERALHGLKMSSAGGYHKKLIVAWMAERFNMPTLEIADLFVDEATPISTLTIEQAVLARFMRDPQWGLDTASRVSDGDFQYVRHQVLWRLLNHAAERDVTTDDFVALADFADRHGYAAEVVDRDFLDAIVERYTTDSYPLEQMIDATFRRRVSDGAKILLQELENANISSDQVSASFTSDIVGLTFWRKGMTEAKTKEEKVQETIDLIMARRSNPDEITGLDIGPCFPKLNSTLRGIQKGRLHVIAAAQSVGKTSFLNNLVAQICIHNNVPGLLIGLEMNYTEYHTRLLAQMTGIDASRIDSSRVNDMESELLNRAAVKLMNSPLHIETPDLMTMEDLKLMVRGYKLRHDVQVVFYDYAQLTAPSKGQARMNRYEVMGEVAKTMKLEIARGMDVAFITAAQLNREGAKEKRPTAENIGDSYQIAQTADTFLIMSEAEGNATVVDLLVDKNRAGHKDILIPMYFDRPTQIIRESENGAKYPSYRLKPRG
jgi:replicative DNA helicase